MAVAAGAVENEKVRVGGHSTASGSACPDCRKRSGRFHSSHLRFPADGVPSAGLRVVLCLWVRRVACGVAACSRQTFVEQVPGLTRRYGRWTGCLRSTLAAVGLPLAGRVGVRMAGAFGVTVSRSMVLRLIEALPEPELPTPRVVGVDAYAMLKGCHYGTVLVDVATRRPVDLLPDREASGLAAWLADRPGIEAVCQDRAPFYAEGTTAGAPQAVQVADRWHLWHLWHNLSETAERCVADHRGCLRGDVPEPPRQVMEGEEPADPTGSPWPTGHRWATGGRQNPDQPRRCAHLAGRRPQPPRDPTPARMAYRTVEPLADASAPKDLFHGQRQGRPSVLERVQALPGRPLEPGLHQRLEGTGGARATRLQP
ncbi:ISL3 family transposase [Streptomyces sp. NPDC018045]|uniref:ISL3 family transposase n=1 Tax=Streptomyces sp. NPDC018045 TaxID=3365037 RepID=UPI0037886BB3